MNSWEQASFTAVEINENIKNNTFVIPPYQRGCVWAEKQKEQFVDTLKRGLPFGTILLYRDETKNQHQIIDGLQRCSTIYNFIDHPAPYFNEDDIEDNLPQTLAKITGVANWETLIGGIKDHLIGWVHSAYQSMEDVRDMQYIDYAYAFISFYPSAQGHEMEIINTVKQTLKRFKDLCENLCTVRIPAIIKGDDDALPEIFERINSNANDTVLAKRIFMCTSLAGNRVI